jgi:photosystem II stability/assembly factor-like uncharacterized protein
VSESSGVTLDLRSICFPVNAENGYVAGGDPGEGVVLKTTDGGTSWAALSVNPGQPIAAISFPLDEGTGFAAGWAGTLLRTADGGNNWDVLSPGVADDLNSLCFPNDPLTGFVTGSGGRVLKTTDGGANWFPTPTGTSDFLASVSFPTPTTGYVVGASGDVYKTTDQGESWFLQPSGTAEFLNSVQFPVDDQTGCAVGRNGVIIKTTDGGGGVEETPNADVRTPSLRATIVRGVLLLPSSLLTANSSLLSIDGRKVLDLHSGANDVSYLAPGVYFISQEPQAASHKPQAVRKVVLAQ